MQTAEWLMTRVDHWCAAACGCAISENRCARRDARARAARTYFSFSFMLPRGVCAVCTFRVCATTRSWCSAASHRIKATRAFQTEEWEMCTQFFRTSDPLLVVNWQRGAQVVACNAGTCFVSAAITWMQHTV